MFYRVRVRLGLRFTPLQRAVPMESALEVNIQREQLPRVAESVLKKRRRNLTEKRRQEQAQAKKRKGKKFVPKTVFSRAERLIKENKKSVRNDIRLQREGKKPEKCQVKAKGDLAFVLRIRGIKDSPQKANTVLSLLRLRRQGDGVFLRLNKTTMSLLQIVEPYITWGHPNLRTVRDLIFKRGRGMHKGKKFQLSDNTQIETALGKFNILCVEDLVHEIFSSESEHFREVNDFLNKFELDHPVGGWKGKSRHVKDGGDFGCRHDKINALLKTLI